MCDLQFRNSVQLLMHENCSKFQKGTKKTEGYFGRLKKETWRCFSFFLFIKLFLSETPNVIFFPERRKI